MIIGWRFELKLRKIFASGARIPNAAGLNGREVAERMLKDHGISGIKIISIPDKLRDHFNPDDNILNLSPEVYGGRSISAMAIAAHECGHIIQEQQASLGLRFRSAVVPILVATSRSFPIVFLVMLFVAIFLPALT